MTNPFGKTVAKPYQDNAYMVYQSFRGDWTWYVLKTYQAPERERSNPYARWFCLVVTPIVPEGELGDVYCSDITSVARRIR
jgi:hypothetical protein